MQYQHPRSPHAPAPRYARAQERGRIPGVARGEVGWAARGRAARSRHGFFIRQPRTASLRCVAFLSPERARSLSWCGRTFMTLRLESARTHARVLLLAHGCLTLLCAASFPHPPPNRAPSRCRARARFCAAEERAAGIVPSRSAAGCSALRAGNPGRARVAGPRRPLHQICGENHNSHTHARRVIKNVCELHDALA